MSKNVKYIKQSNPFVIPTTDGKIMEEHFGHTNDNSDISIAKMTAPPGWSEPFQTPDFDEFSFVLKGKKQINIDGEIVILKEGESIRIIKNTRVQYSNPFEEECEYIAICLPAFSVGLANRE